MMILSLFLGILVGPTAGMPGPTGDNFVSLRATESRKGIRLIGPKNSLLIENRILSNSVTELQYISCRISDCSDLLTPEIKRRALLIGPAKNQSFSTARRLAVKLQHAFPGERICLDPISPETDRRLGTLNELLPPSKGVVALVALQSLKITDGKAIQDARGVLSKNGIQVVELGKTLSPLPRRLGSDVKSVIVVTGHSDQQLKAFIANLGDAGAFTNRIVILNSCETPLTESMIESINGKYGAVATYTHTGTITGRQVSMFMKDLSAQWRNARGSQGPNSFADLVRLVAHRHNLQGIWTVCESANECVL